MSVTKLVKMYKYPILGHIARQMVLLLGCDIPRKVKIGSGVVFPHNSIGTVIHEKTVIEDNVKIYQNVTLGRADIFLPSHDFKGILLEEGCCICAGAKILAKEEKIIIGRGAVIGANALLLNSVGPGEIWGGFLQN